MVGGSRFEYQVGPIHGSSSHLVSLLATVGWKSRSKLFYKKHNEFKSSRLDYADFQNRWRNAPRIFAGEFPHCHLSSEPGNTLRSMESHSYFTCMSFKKLWILSALFSS